MDKKAFIKLEAKKELARRSFFYYCNLMAPGFYTEDKDFLVDLCNQLEDFYFSQDKLLVINMPPRHGKSRTAGKFAEWVLGKNPSENIMTGSYNETLSSTFSKAVRNTIQEQKTAPEIVTYSDVFPESKIKRGESAMNLWSLEGQHNSYLATSPTGTATGFGASLMIIDDLIKNEEEARNDNVLEKLYDWFTNTMLSRLEENGKIIIVMTRWSKKDLSGKAIEYFESQGYPVRLVKYKAVQEDGTMLCPEILSREFYELKANAMGNEVASANYQQEPVDIKGTLYKNLKTYTEAPEDFDNILSYCDTADQGKDNLCNIIFGVKQGYVYILDVYYTSEGMEVTEEETARRLNRHGVKLAIIESNNGGKGFSRNVKRILWEKHNARKPSIKWFHQSKNKMARILSNSTFIMDNVFFPEDWATRWKEFYKDITTFQKNGKNKHDDGPDALTGVAESVDGNKIQSISKSKLGI